MTLIQVKPELIEVEYWMISTYSKFQLKNPTSSMDAINNFILVKEEFADLKWVINLSKQINLLDSKTNVVEFPTTTLSLGVSSTPFIHSELLRGQDEAILDKAKTYMIRIGSALATIENAALNAANTPGEGTDTTIFSQEEKEARKRLEKANRRLLNLFKGISEVEATAFVPAYTLPTLHQTVVDFIEQNN